ncbi:MAG: ribbon-helix-helix domain-containing protein [Patescibacteria group bacterium]
MRNIINISLPQELAKGVRKEVKRENYASMSEFFRHLLRAHKLNKELEKAKKDFAVGENF